MSTAGDEARFQLMRQVAESAHRIRDLLLANPAPDPDPPGRRQSPSERIGTYPLGMVLDQLGAEHTAVLGAVAGYPRALAYHPTTGRRDDLGPALARLVTALAGPVIRFHGQTELRDGDVDAIVLNNELRDVLVAATMLLSEVGPLEVDVHQYAQRLPADADSRWRACLVKAAAFAEPAWSRARHPEHPVHLLGLQMLAMALYVVSIERRLDPADVLPWHVIDLLGGVAGDRMWTSASERESLPAGTVSARRAELRHELASRDRRVNELRTRVETVLTQVGVDIDTPGEAHRDLVGAWLNLQQPAPMSSDLSINGTKPPYTWRPHLPEGVLRAASYLGIYRPLAA